MENARYIQDRFQFTHPVWGATEIESRELDVARPFQFTHPVWGATLSPLMHRLDYFRFNSRTPCGVRQHGRNPPPATQGFNSRTPCGVRRQAKVTKSTDKSFNSRTPCGVRRTYSAKPLPPTSVSIHAPRVGCDLNHRSVSLLPAGFNSRTPCGVRRHIQPIALSMDLFQFTHPVWGATPVVSPPGATLKVSIHAPRVGCDTDGADCCKRYAWFQFTHPVWGATAMPKGTHK